MKVFLPCINTCADAMDISCTEHEITLSLFTLFVNEKSKVNVRFKACYSPSYQEKIINSIIDTMNEEWMEKSDEEIKEEVEVIRKVHSALELEGEFLDKNLPVSNALFELARYLNDDNEVYIITNYKDKIKDELNKWKTEINKLSLELNIITPAEAFVVASKD